MSFFDIFTSGLISNKQQVPGQGLFPWKPVVFPVYPSQLFDLAAFLPIKAVFAIELLAL